MASPAGTATQAGTVVYGCVLVPLDGSHIAAEALPHAVEIARRCNARLVLLHVVPDTGEDKTTSRDSQAGRAQTEAYFAGLKRWLERYGVQVDCLIEDGLPAEMIAAVARTLDRPLIVLTRCGKTAATEAGDKQRLGTVAEQLSTYWDGPLSLIKPVA
jgi:nucleotide-binding universal stress UspA family protein